MQKVTVLMGPSASGKSRFLKKNNIKGTVLSSDQLRLEIFGTLEEQDSESHKIIFNEIHNRTIDLLEQGGSVILDATNINRKRRIYYYNEIIKRNFKDVHVETIVFIEPLSLLKENNKNKPVEEQVDENVIERMYKTVAVPRIGVDTDSVKVEGLTPFFKDKISINKIIDLNSIEEFVDLLSDEYREEMKRLFESHETPYHLEDIHDHINMCIENSGNFDLMKLISLFHDLGKSVTKEEGRYMFHANVSAMYSLKAFNELNVLNESWDIIETVYQHMNAHDGVGKKNIRRNKLPGELIELIELFAEIDDQSRIVGII